MGTIQTKAYKGRMCSTNSVTLTDRRHNRALWISAADSNGERCDKNEHGMNYKKWYEMFTLY